MTEKEMYEHAFNIAIRYGFCGDCRRSFKSKGCIVCDCYENSVKIIEDALDKIDKYRWHDLRKNPDDLPERDGEFSKIVMVTDGVATYAGSYCYEDVPRRKHGKAGTWNMMYKPWPVIAWRYIEPFEEASED